MKHQERVCGNPQGVLAELRSRLPIFHRSNLFLRDLQFGIQRMLATEKIRISNREAEALARAFATTLEKVKILLPIDHQTWMVNYPEFQTAARAR